MSNSWKKKTALMLSSNGTCPGLSAACLINVKWHAITERLSGADRPVKRTAPRITSCSNLVMECYNLILFATIQTNVLQRFKRKIRTLALPALIRINLKLVTLELCQGWLIYGFNLWFCWHIVQLVPTFHVCLCRSLKKLLKISCVLEFHKAIIHVVILK